MTKIPRSELRHRAEVALAREIERANRLADEKVAHGITTLELNEARSHIQVLEARLRTIARARNGARSLQGANATIDRLKELAKGES